MPYVITTKRPSNFPNWGMERTTTTAVATLDEAQDAACESVHRAFDQPGFDEVHSPHGHGAALDSVWALPASGGTIGPLPDGTVIEMQRVTWESLMAANGMRERGPTTVQILDAYNAR